MAYNALSWPQLSHFLPRLRIRIPYVKQKYQKYFGGRSGKENSKTILRRDLLHCLHCLHCLMQVFLGLYQFIMRRNDQNKPEVVEHDYFEGETSFDSMWQNRFDLSWISVIFLIILLNLTLPTTYRHFLLTNLCLQIIVQLTFWALFLSFTSYPTV